MTNKNKDVYVVLKPKNWWNDYDNSCSYGSFDSLEKAKECCEGIIAKEGGQFKNRLYIQKNDESPRLAYNSTPKKLYFSEAPSNLIDLILDRFYENGFDLLIAYDIDHADEPISLKISYGLDSFNQEVFQMHYDDYLYDEGIASVENNLSGCYRVWEDSDCYLIDYYKEHKDEFFNVFKEFEDLALANAEFDEWEE